MNTWDTLADEKALEVARQALEKNGFTVEVVETGAEAKAKVLALIPEGAEVMDMTSITLETIGLAKEIQESGRFDAVKKKLSGLDRKTDHRKMQALGAAPQWAVGSVHAVTQDGHVFIASNTGSQLPAYVYGAEHVVWVVGTQKIVKNDQDAQRRIYTYVLPLESERARRAYNLPDTYESFVSNLLIMNRHVSKGRITIIFVKEKLGY